MYETTGALRWTLVQHRYHCSSQLAEPFWLDRPDLAITLDQGCFTRRDTALEGKGTTRTARVIVSFKRVQGSRHHHRGHSEALVEGMFHTILFALSRLLEAKGNAFIWS
jgi:hypothetical protein